MSIYSHGVRNDCLFGYAKGKPVVSYANKYHNVAELVQGNIRYVFRVRPSDKACAVRKYQASAQVGVQHFPSLELMRNRYRFLKRDGFVPA